MGKILATDNRCDVVLTRRSSLLLAAAAIAAPAALLATSTPAWAQAATDAGAPSLGDDFWAPDRFLQLRYATGETIRSQYMADGSLHEPGYVELCYFLRDRVVGEAVTIDLRLLDILYGINGWLAYHQVPSSFVITSGHRNRRRNAKIEGAALDSRHITGQAVDGEIPGVDPLQIARFGRWLGAGGVGWYPQKKFVHLDTGRVRTWRG